MQSAVLHDSTDRRELVTGMRPAGGGQTGELSATSSSCDRDNVTVTNRTTCEHRIYLLYLAVQGRMQNDMGIATDRTVQA